MHSNSLLLFNKYARSYLKSGLKIIEIGPGDVPSVLCQTVNDHSIQWDTLDIGNFPGVTYVTKDEYDFPVQGNTYDVVIALQVIEHVRKIWRWLPELARITKPGGRVIIINPVSWIYHEAPVDCWRIYPDGMKALCEDSGLETEICLWESLESPGYKRYMPGNSRESHGLSKRLVQGILGPLGFPVERAYDTITIAKKRTPL